MFKVLIFSCWFFTFSLNLFADPQWSRPHTISTLGASVPNVEIDSSGNAVAIWREFTSEKTKIQAARFTKGKWSKLINLSVFKGQYSIVPQIAVNNNGHAVAVWNEYVKNSTIIKAATMTDKGVWSKPVILTQFTPQNLHENFTYESIFDPTLSVALSPSGYAVAAWTIYSDPKNLLEASTLQFGGEWSEPVTIAVKEKRSFSGGCVNVVVDSSNNAAVIWDKFSFVESDENSILVSTLQYGGNWSEALSFLSGYGPQVVFDSLGNLIALWNKCTDGDCYMYTSTFSFRGNWSEPTIFSKSKNARIGQLVFDQEGNALAVWEVLDEEVPNEKIHIESSYRPFGGDWSEPLTISGKNELSTEPKAAFDFHGNAIVTWDDIRNTEKRGEKDVESVVLTCSRAANGTWSEPVTLSARNQYSFSPRIAVSPEGISTIVWSNKTFTVIQAAESK